MVMIESRAEFGKALSKAIYAIKYQESKSIAVIQDELGYELGRKGGSSIEYWRKGNIPSNLIEVEHLSTMLLERGDLDRDWLLTFLKSCLLYTSPSPRDS